MGNKEKYLGDVEASEFLWGGKKMRMTGSREEVDGWDDDREGAGEGEKEREGDKNKSLLALNLFFVEVFTSEWGRHHRGADGEGWG